MWQPWPTKSTMAIGGEPITHTNTEVLRPFDSPDASGEIRAQQAGISSLVRKPTDSREPAVNRVGRQLT